MKNNKHKHETHHAHNEQRKNNRLVWQIATGALAIILIISVFTAGFGLRSSKSGKSLTADEVSQKSVEYINKYLLNGQGTAKVDSIMESNGMYMIHLDVNGQKLNSYATKDGQLLFPQAFDLTQAPKQQAAEQEEVAPANVQKSDKPKVELFVMSHCPYGTQIEKGILPVAKALDGKIDFEVKFVNYAMHGEKELQEQLRQYCVQKNYRSKYLQYLSAFLEAGDSTKALSAIGVTDADLSSCVKEADTTYKVTESFKDPAKTGWSGNFPPFDIYDAENQKYGVRGSPTLVINGAQVQSGRDAKSLLSTICTAFNNKPSECSTDMSSYGNPAPGFGFGTQGGTAAAAGCGA